MSMPMLDFRSRVNMYDYTHRVLKNRKEGIKAGVADNAASVEVEIIDDEAEGAEVGHGVKSTKVLKKTKE